MGEQSSGGKLRGLTTAARLLRAFATAVLAVAVSGSVVFGASPGDTAANGPDERAGSPVRNSRPIRVGFESIPNMPVVLPARPGKPDPTAAGESSAQRGGDCFFGEIVTHTDANFEGGSYTLQAGFVANETAIATYSVPAEQFPIEIESMEAILAQFEATATVTKYSFLVWDGPPDMGLLRAVYKSDDVQISHARIPAGTNGVNIKILIDPADPDQLVLNDDSGTHSFSIGFRIDEHNFASLLPCLLPPDVSQNAFPVTDLSSADLNLNDNWLDALLCGSGCDGLNTFAQLPPICRPSGDWVIRATYRCPNAPEPAGACCDANQTCTDGVLLANCNGTFMGANSSCAGTQCPAPRGACCLPPQYFCLSDATVAECDGILGSFAGIGTTCFSPGACTPGACCMPDGSCEDVPEFECADLQGDFQGSFSNCATAGCPQPPGSCCIGCACFINVMKDDCELNFSGTWNGPDSTCDGVACSPGGDIIQAVPLRGTVDARQPHPPDDQSLGARSGIGGAGEEIKIVLSVGGARPNCFELVETAPDPILGPNSIVSATEGPAQVWTIRLHHPIAAGGATAVRYFDGFGWRSVEYIAHPANVDAGPFADVADIAFLMAILDGNETAPHGLYSIDIDHDGAFGTGDILRAMDLLNGADLYDEWLDSPRP